MKKIIAIICGGDTSEHDVSMRSAAGIESFLDKDRYCQRSFASFILIIYLFVLTLSTFGGKIKPYLIIITDYCRFVKLFI